MARQPRYVIPGQPQHVIQRGNNRSPTFFDGPDRHFYLECLCEACMRYGCAVHAYVLMTNHVHLLVTPATENGIGKVMQSVGRRYVQYANCTYGRTGTLWEGRYRATLVDSEAYLLTCMRYIELNPVRARMVADPGQYPWSSYPANGQGRPDALVIPHSLYEGLGADPGERQSAYRGLVAVHLDDATLGVVRDATNKGWVLGSARFTAEVEALLNRRGQPLPRGGDRRSAEYARTRGSIVRW
jgi:putative transposase